MKLVFFLLTFLFIYGFNQSVLSQPLQKVEKLVITVTGNEKKIANAKVKLVVWNQDYSEESITDKNGKVIFQNVPVGKAYVIIIKKRYDTFRKNIELKKGLTNQEFRFSLEKEKISQSDLD